MGYEWLEDGVAVVVVALLVAVVFTTVSVIRGR